jgi:hypothetical protein
MESRRAVADFEIVRHGIDNSQYFQGCGVAFTEYEACFTGIGNNPNEALDDALEQAAVSGWDVESIKNDQPTKPKVSAKAEDCYYYLSIRLK